MNKLLWISSHDDTDCLRVCWEIENIGDRINFVVTKPQSIEQTVYGTDGTGRPAIPNGVQFHHFLI
jgi:hypothetical protein